MQAVARLGVVLLLAAAAAAARSPPAVRKVDWRVTLAVAAPDCFERPALLVNGELSPTLEVTQGEMLELTVHNDVPADYPSVSKGISIHFHGWRMRGQPWYDGVGFLEQCPIVSGGKMTYRFPVNEMPGTYMWHGHNGADRVDGLGGALIVRPAGPPVVPLQYDGERVLMLGDWWHTEASALAMSLNRPFDTARQTNDSGGWVWVGNPESLLINGAGFFQDCAIGAAGSTALPVCNVSEYWVPPGRSAVLPWASAVNPGCAHANITVTPGKTYLFRIINAGALVYQTLCFEGHNVTVVAADTVPVQHFKAPGGCVDVNSGQRLDVLLKADQPPASYWITAQAQYRNGSPSAYAVLRYKGAREALPATPLPQPGSVAPWTPQQQTKWLRMSSRLLGRKDKRVAGGVYREAMTKVPAPTLRLQLNVTQPLMAQTGQLRWALNNVAEQQPPPCQPLLDLVYQDPAWIEANVVPASRYNSPRGFNASALGVQEAHGSRAQVFLATPDLEAHPPPIYPTAGTNILPLKKGEVLEVVLQNLAANAANGDYREPEGANRTAQEQHPFHLHGHHFWLMGQGLGEYDAKADASQLNTRDPPLRDTATLPQNGWVVLRFQADNPGLWSLHCHLFWHQYMGQGLVVAEDVKALAKLKRPDGLPTCPDTCTANGAPWTNAVVQKEFGTSGFQLPAAG